MFGFGNDLQIGVSLTLRDMFSTPARNAGMEMTNLHEKSRRLAQDNMRAVRDMSMSVAAGGAFMLYGMSRWIATGAEFGYTMQFVKSITKATNEEFDKLYQGAKKLGGSTIFTPSEIASGMQYMAMAGMTSKQVKENIQAATLLGQATTSPLGGKGGSADIMTNLMKGFQIQAENSTQVADVLTTSVTSANTNLFDLGEGMKYAMSTAKDLGVSLEETAAMMMVLGNAGIQGSMAGTAMENMLRYYTKVGSQFRSGRQTQAMEAIGLKPDDILNAQGDLRSINDLMSRLAEKTKDMKSGERYNVFSVLFGVRGNRAAMLAKRDLSDYNDFVDKLKNQSMGSAGRIGGELMATLQGRILQLRSAWDNFKISFTKSLEPALKPVVFALTKTVDLFRTLFDTPVLGTFLSSGIAGFLTITTVTAGFTAVLSTMSLLISKLKGSMVAMSTSGVRGFNALTVAAGRASAATKSAYASQSMAGGNKGWTKPSGFLGLLPFVHMLNRNKAGGLQWKKGAMVGGQKVGGQMAGGIGVGRSRGILGKIATYMPWVGRSLGVLGRLFGALLGPVGLIVSFLLPSVIGGISSLIEENRKTRDQKKLKAQSYLSGAERGLVTYEVMPERRMIMGGTTRETSDDNATWKQTRIKDLVINIDGETKMRETIEDVASEQAYEQGINLNL